GNLIALGDAPSWTARTEGFKRLVGGRPITVDPWRLFPDWFRSVAPLPPGPGAAKARQVALIESLQSRPPLWVRVQGAEPEKVWDELRSQNLKLWIHRRLTDAAKLDPDVDLYHLPAFEHGRLEVQDLASQAVAHIAQPDPGERWWDVCAGAGGKALHLAALMQGKGVVVASDPNEVRLKEAVRRARRSPFRNVSTKLWDGKHVVGKAGKYDGVLVDAPCSGLGTWRRNPESRWTLDADAVNRLSALQTQILQTASAGVKVGGALVYSVCTFTHAETRSVIDQFLQAHPGFQLDPFSSPLSGVETDGTLQIWPGESDHDAMFVARMIRTA
ncbi:MAG TPA: RsmB/NOP family class I SAM-dependent RNA methyltransferase, partial [Isosphaeraceae bacterium]|nr:RsmB/NOP family class I SAM-dependent RNA methyltransferase [Isosphaeraceae bacterium]